MTNGNTFFLLRLNDHLQYLNQIERTLSGNGHFKGIAHTECELGRWIYGRGAQEITALHSEQAQQVFESIKQPHENFHLLSHQAVARKQAGDEEGARAAFREMHRMSVTICSKLLELDKMSF